MRLIALALAGLSLIACGVGEGDPCPPGSKVADIPLATANNPAGRSITCLPTDKPLPDGARWL